MNLAFFPLDTPTGEVADQMIRDFRRGTKIIPWEVIPKRKFFPLWREFGGKGIIRRENDLEEIWMLTICNLKKVIAASELLHYGLAGYEELADSEVEAFVEYLRPRPDLLSCYTDQDFRFGFHLSLLEGARAPEAKLVAVDRVIGLIHGRGPVADWFIEGGYDTCSNLRDQGTESRLPKIPTYFPEQASGRVVLYGFEPSASELRSVRWVSERVGWRFQPDKRQMIAHVTAIDMALTCLRHHGMEARFVRPFEMLKREEQDYLEKLCPAIGVKWQAGLPFGREAADVIPAAA